MKNNDPVLAKWIMTYARKGIKDWRSMDLLMKGAIKDSLTPLKIVENVYEISPSILGTVRPQRRVRQKCRFIPTPTHGYSTKLQQCFFLPIRRSEADNRIDFELLVRANDNCNFAFRLESSDEPTHAHSYPHAQFITKLCDKSIDLDRRLVQLPTAYPALPIPGYGPRKLFLSLLIAIHGFPPIGHHHRWFDRVFDVMTGPIREVENVLGEIQKGC